MKRVGTVAAALAAMGLVWACSTADAPSATPSGADAAASTPPDATPLPSTDGGPPPDASAPDAGRVDAGDASAVDAGDASAVDAGDASDASAPLGPVAPGVDGVLRGAVKGTFTHAWHGVIQLPASLATCPAPAPAGTPITMNGGQRCCVWDGSFRATTVANIPVVFDPTTRTGTLAGAAIGTFAAMPPDGAGTVGYVINPSAFHLTNGWKAAEAIGVWIGEDAARIAQSQDFFTLIASGAVREVLISISKAEVRWNPGTMAFSIRETHPITPGTAGRCGSENATGTSSYFLSSP